jgi:hypothetical protein
MKKLAIIALTALLLSLPIHQVLAETCSCSASDGSCTASITCTGGCMAYCPDGGGCVARCSSGSATKGLPPRELVSLQMRDGSSKQLSEELGRITGQEIVLAPYNPKETYTFDFKNALLWDVLEVLSQRAKVEIAGEDFGKLLRIRKAFVNGEKMSVCIRRTSVRNIVDQLASLSGLSLYTTSGNVDALVTLSLKDVTLTELVAKVSEKASVQIAGLDVLDQ